MDTRPEHIDELIASYLAGEASPEERATVERWREENEEHRKYFRHLELIFGKAASVRETLPFDTDEAWRKVSENLKLKKTRHIRPWSSGYPFLRIAAGVIFLLAAGLFAYRFLAGDTVRRVEVLAGRETLSDTLPDGSAVFLNRQTKIEYSFDEKQDIHVAKLSGEAYFDIHHENEKGLIVEAGETFIKDVGTSFNVRAYPEHNTIEVIVDEGEVVFYTKNDPGIHLGANGKGIYDRTTGKFAIASPEPNATAYKTRSFTFSNNTLAAVVRTLNGVYETDLKIEKNLEECRLTVSFNEESMEEIAHVIAETLGLSVEEESDGIWLRGAGCGEAPSE